MPDAFERKILRRKYNPIKGEKGWKMRNNAEICNLCKDMKGTGFIKFRKLQVIRMEKHRRSKKARKRREMERERMPSCCLVYELGKLKTNTENSGGNPYWRARLDLGCNAILAAAYLFLLTVIPLEISMSFG
jgi:hypothetical protein